MNSPKFIIYILFCFFSFSQSISGLSVLAHRGGRAHFPENTLAAIQYALDLDVDFVEFDLRASKDDYLVLYHDEKINPSICSSNGDQLGSWQWFLGQDSPTIRSLPLSELKKYDCGSKTHPDFPTQIPVPEARIPTFEEALNLIQNYLDLHPESKVKLLIEIKINSKDTNLSPEIWAQKIENHLSAFNFIQRTLIDSINQSFKKKINSYLSSHHIEYPFEKAKAVPYFALTENWVKWAQSRGYKVYPWTVNNEVDWKRLIQWGVDGIITDHPQELKLLLNL